MRAVLLDTDVFSFVFKRDSRAALCRPELEGAEPCVCFQTVAELRLWALVRRWGESRRRTLDTSMARCGQFPYDDATSRHWAEITALPRRIGQPIECGDAWIAATALRHQIPLITHNSIHYQEIPGLKVISHPESP
jgi:tRNA(fMet)-specific endonuclease VapC